MHPAEAAATCGPATRSERHTPAVPSGLERDGQFLLKGSPRETQLDVEVASGEKRPLR